MASRFHSGLLLVPLLLAPGCSVTQSRIDAEIHGLAAQIGEASLSRPASLPPEPPPSQAPGWPETPTPEKQPSPLQPVAFVQNEPKPTRPERPRFPSDLPGAEAPPFQPPKDPARRKQAIRDYLPPIEPLPALPPPVLGPEGKPLSLADLQKLGKQYSPAIKNAIAAVEAARANAYDAGMYPNPSVAYEHDTVATGPAGYPGFWIDQIIKTGGKLTVAQAAATMDVLNAQLALRRAHSDLRYQIRGFYFAVLVARESLRVSEALFQFVNEIYEMQVERAMGPDVAVYEPMQLRPTVLQAQLAVITARNQYLAAWHQLAAVLGLPDLPLTLLEGQVDAPIPAFTYKDVAARLDKHTDVLSARVAIMKAKYNLMQQKLVPLPDVDMRVLVQKDFTAPPNQIAHSFVMSMPIPLWDQNRGGIRQAEWLLAQAAAGPDQARNALIGVLAEAYGRYQTAQRTVAIVQEQLRDQVRVYRGLRQRYETGAAGTVGFTDLFVAQQSLAGFIASYITALGSQWQAVVDVANLLQTEDLFGLQPPEPMPPTPDLNHLQPPPAPVADPPGPLASLLKLFQAPPAQESGVRSQESGPVPGSPQPLPPPAPLQLPPPGPALRGNSAASEQQEGN